MEQLELAALLLGLPLYYDHDFLPDKQHVRDTSIVDKWISAHPKPPKIYNETKAIIAQEFVNYKSAGSGRSHLFRKEDNLYSRLTFNAEGFSKNTSTLLVYKVI